MNEERLQETRKKLDELAKVLPPRGRVLIIPHDYPDPDAFASAAALHLLLLKRYRLQGQIVFTGMVTRAENREMLRHCRYRWRLLSQLREPPRGKVPCLFVDAQPRAGNVTMPPFGKPVAVIDHHPTRRGRGLAAGAFLDVRVGAGATATLLHEYLTAAEIPIPRWLASIMAYAIATETMDLSRNCMPEDLEAYTALLARANMTIVGKIRHAPLPRTYYLQLQDALKSAFVFGRVAWAHVQNVVQPEIVPEIADLLCRMERTTWSFCTGYHGDNLLVSLRSSQPGAHCGSVIKRALKKIGSGGGHDWMAAGSVNMAGMAPERREEVRETVVKTLLSRIEKRPVQQEALEVVGKSLVQPAG